MKKQKDWKTLPIMLAAYIFALMLILNLCAAMVLDFISDIYANFESTIYVKEVESGKRWNSLVQLNVFEDYNGELLYPTCEGSYGFEIHNDVDFPISYKLTISDQNIANVPMEFRLKDETGAFILGHENEWVSISALQNIPGTLEYSGYTTYTLDWRWSGEEDTEDTAAGIIAQNRTMYVLNFEVLGSQNGAPINSGIDPAPELTNLAFWITLLATALFVLIYSGIWAYIHRKNSGGKENEAN